MKAQNVEMASVDAKCSAGLLVVDVPTGISFLSGFWIASDGHAPFQNINNNRHLSVSDFGRPT